MQVSEIFHTLQGEGYTVGKPAIFVRLGMCNLHCSWCDTPYCWKEGEEDYSDQKNKRVVEDISDYLNEFPNTKIIVWTGGEPLMQQQDIIGISEWLRIKYCDRDLEFEVETNGTIPPNDHLDGIIDRYNCSPKLSNSGNNPYTPRFKDFIHKTTFKYVVADEKDCMEVVKEIERCEFPRDKCMFMVMGTTREEMIEKGLEIAEISKDTGIPICIRLQCLLWGAKRRV